MIYVHEKVPGYKAAKPINCPTCGNNRIFDVPNRACVRTSKRGRYPPDTQDDIVLIKCQKCNTQVGVSVEHNWTPNG